MENDEKAGMAPDAGMATPRQTATAAEAHPKPMLTVEQQIAHMKTKGITFNLVSEGEAAAHLREKCQFFRVYAYRKLFPKHVGGPRDGQYVGLDFGNLKELSNLDRKLRDALLPMTLDVEHFAKVRLLAAAEDRGEDGYALMRDYLEASTDEQRNHLRTELKQRRNDPYAGAVVRKYQGDMPVWAFCEVVSFGTFTDLLRFCAARWDDKKLRRDHYQYKDTRQVRNASAHGACILNDITSSDVPARPPAALVNAMNSYGIPRRLRTKWLSGRRMVQICSLAHIYAATVPEGSARSERKSQLSDLFAAVEASSLPAENPAIAALRFLQRLTKAAGLLD